MSSQWGKHLKVTTFGESHGKAMGGVLDGVPANTPIDLVAIQSALDARRPGQSRHTSQRKEPDSIEILSGVLDKKALGSPIAFAIQNSDVRSHDYEALKTVFRPGHADFSYQKKYGVRDHRGGGRASARETVNWVAAGQIARQVLLHQLQKAKQKQPSIRACLQSVGTLQATSIDWTVVSPEGLFWPEPSSTVLEDYLGNIRRQKDAVGAVVVAEILDAPVGLGEPVFDKMDAEIAKLMMAIPAAKGVEIGDGFAAASALSSAHRDAITPEGFLSNHAGGILGGVTTGQTIALRVAFKPTSSIPQGIKSIDEQNKSVHVPVKGRHDPCVGIRAVPVVESLLWLLLADFWLRAQTTSEGVL